MPRPRLRLMIALLPFVNQLVGAAARAEESFPGELLPQSVGLTESVAEIQARESKLEPAPEGSLESSARQRPEGASSTSFLAVTVADAGFIPPDPSGDVGPTQILVATQGRIRVFDRAGGLGSLDVTTDTFFASVRNGGTAQPRVRYDRLSERWFVTMIDVGACPNNLLLAVSSGPTIVDATSFTFFSFVAEADHFADSPSLGVDRHAVYIGANMFDLSGVGCSSPFDPVRTTVFVIDKADLLDDTLSATAFRNIAGGAGAAGPWAPQGVHNDDPAATEGYFIGVDFLDFSLLQIRRILDPGGSPTISANLPLAVPATAFPQSVPQPAPGPVLDGSDDRLRAAAIRRNRITGASTLWTAHQFEVDATGAASATGGRVGSRWYEIGDLATTPSLVQSGTLFDSAVTTPFNYWPPTAIASGQGRMAIAASRASASVVNGGYVGVAVAGRLRTDPSGTLGPADLVQSSTFLYDQSGGPPELWGWNSATVVDPNDDQTIWTFQSYANALNSWGVRVIELPAPPPATPDCTKPVQVGALGTEVTIEASSVDGSEFFDPGPDTGGPGFAGRLLAEATNGLIVNSVTFVSPTSVTLDVTPTSLGPADVTITNPDGQSVVASGCIVAVSALLFYDGFESENTSEWDFTVGGPP